MSDDKLNAYFVILLHRKYFYMLTTVVPYHFLTMYGIVCKLIM